MKVQSRLSAFLIHSTISVLILVAVLVVIFFFWYPNGLISAGGTTGLKIIIGVYLILGPLLTLVVFSPGKKGLKFDLWLIAILQTSCLLYGLYMVHSQRPLVQVLIDDGVHLLSAADIKLYGADIDYLPGSYPKRVYIHLPKDRSTWSVIKFTSEFADEKPFSFRSDLYRSLSDMSVTDYNERLSIILESMSDQDINLLNGSDSQGCTWIPIYSPHTKGYACFSRSEGIEKLSG